MIFAAICRLNGSPGPSPGAPLKSPMVSRTEPSEPTAPAPDARLMWLNKLNISARSCTFTRSVTGMFLITDRSKSAKPGPEKAFLPRSPARFVGCPAGQLTEGVQNAAGLTHCSPGSDPPSALENVCETPANGLESKFSPGRCVPDAVVPAKLNGCPPWNDIKLLICQPWLRMLGPCEDPGMS